MPKQALTLNPLASLALRLFKQMDGLQSRHPDCHTGTFGVTSIAAVVILTAVEPAVADWWRKNRQFFR
jgi:hypothetical protein